MRELKPCPFCGEHARIERSKNNQFQVACNHDERCYLYQRVAPRYNIRDIAEKQWNRREENG